MSLEAGAARRVVDDVADGVDAAGGLGARVHAVVVDAGALAGAAEAVAVGRTFASVKKERTVKSGTVRGNRKKLYLQATNGSPK